MVILIRFIVSGRSMEPSFKSGQTLLVSGFHYLFRKPKVGDVVVVKDPRDPSTSSGQAGRLLLKRIKTIQNRHSGERKRHQNRFWTSQNDREEEEYFVAGDNPKSSTDSRTFGPITKENIVGKVLT